MTDQEKEAFMENIKVRLLFAMNAENWPEAMAGIHAAIDLIDAAQGKHAIRDEDIPF